MLPYSSSFLNSHPDPEKLLNRWFLSIDHEIYVVAVHLLFQVYLILKTLLLLLDCEGPGSLSRLVKKELINGMITKHNEALDQGRNSNVRRRQSS
jgi:hypothetical protein